MVGFRVALLCHIPNFRCLCQSVLSLGVFAKLLGVGGAGGDGWILGGNPVSHTKILGLYVNPFSHKKFLPN